MYLKEMKKAAVLIVIVSAVVWLTAYVRQEKCRENPEEFYKNYVLIKNESNKYKCE